jgi:hypothetical protein
VLYILARADLVPRALCNMSSASWTWQYKDDFLSCLIARWVYSRGSDVLDVEVRSHLFWSGNERCSHVTYSLPGAIGMYALSLGVQHIGEVLPDPVYALLSGLNASTVGIIMLAAVLLAEKAIKDKLSRILVILGACAGICYNSLWYFPLLMLLGGLAAAVWDGWMSQKIRKLKAKLKRRRSGTEVQVEEASAGESIPLEEIPVDNRGVQRRSAATSRSLEPAQPKPTANGTYIDHIQPHLLDRGNSSEHVIKVRAAVIIISLFFGMCSPMLIDLHWLTGLYRILY